MFIVGIHLGYKVNDNFDNFDYWRQFRLLGSTHKINLQSPWHCPPAKTINNKIIKVRLLWIQYRHNTHICVYDVTGIQLVCLRSEVSISMFMRKYFWILILESQSISFIRIGIFFTRSRCLLFKMYGYRCSASSFFQFDEIHSECVFS